MPSIVLYGRPILIPWLVAAKIRLSRFGIFRTEDCTLIWQDILMKFIALIGVLTEHWLQAQVVINL